MSSSMSKIFKCFLFIWLLVGCSSIVFSAGSAAREKELATKDGLVLKLNDSGLVTDFMADKVSLLSDHKKGGFFIGEYLLNSGPNILENGGFEDKTDFKMTGGWERDESTAYQGKTSMLLNAEKKGDLSLHFLLQPNKVYLLTCYIKTEQLEAIPVFHMRNLDSKGKLVCPQNNIEQLYSSPEWLPIRHTFETHSETVSGELLIHVPYDYRYGNQVKGKLWIDDVSICELRQPELLPVSGKSLSVTKGISFKSEKDGIRLKAEYTAQDDYISVNGELQDNTGKDRCIQLAYRLPVDAQGWNLATGMDMSSLIEAGKTYIYATGIGKSERRIISPTPYSSIDGQNTGLSISVPMDCPLVYRMGYDKDGYYFIRFDLGLSLAAKKFPSKSKFSFIISRHDPGWGLRAAAKKYFNTFPQFFTVRTKPGSVISGYSLFSRLKDFQDFGGMYADRHFGAFERIKAAKEAGFYSMSYNEPWMWRSEHFKKVSEVPSCLEEIIEKEKADIDKWKEKDIRDYYQFSRAYSVRAFFNSAYHDENGKPIANGLRLYGGGPVFEWLTNPDPEITGDYGEANRGMLSWQEYDIDYQGAKNLGAVNDGIRYDSVTEWCNLGVENFRSGHFVFADFPLTFSYRAGRPCQLGYFGVLEYMIFARTKLLAQNGITYANGAVNNPWMTWLLDGIFLESKSVDITDAQNARLLMYHKNIGDWNAADFSLPEDKFEDRLNSCLAYCWWFGLSGGTAKTIESKRGLFKKYVPILRALAEAGWEPVTYAYLKPKEQMIIERFGGEFGKPMFFSIYNREDKKQKTDIYIDSQVLGIGSDSLKIEELISGAVWFTEKTVSKGIQKLTLDVPAKRALVLSVKIKN